MRVLMLGWEFPPFISGGLGTACYGLTKAMSEAGVQILFLLPRPVQTRFSTHVTLMSPPQQPMSGSREYRVREFERVRFRTIDAAIRPYQTPAEYAARGRGARAEPGGAEGASPDATTAAAAPAEEAPYGGDLFAEVDRYARLASRLALAEEFDIIHAHDWMTFPAGIALAGLTGKPLVVHFHSTEFDRGGEHPDERICQIERRGVESAARIIAVSYLTRGQLVARYAARPDRVEVVHNAIDAGSKPVSARLPAIRRGEKIVLFLGRITMQKGPEYFLAAARKVLQVMQDVRFIVVGSGDMQERMVQLAARMGIGHKVLFEGFLQGEQLERAFRSADLYVMSSVSEPFGLAPLEALCHDIPVIISKQSGVSEVLTHALKVDFWDINEMANKIVAVLRHPPLHATLREHGGFEVRRLSWADAAQRCLDVYRRALATCKAPSG